MRGACRGVGGALVALLVAGCGGGGGEGASAPAPAEPVPVATTAEEVGTPVRVYYDALRSPHVFAATDAAALFGLGYTQMRDFPVATLANLWSTSGRYAEVAGPRALPRDLRVRAWGVDRLARLQAEDDALLDPEVRALLAAYVDGVNAGRRFWLERPELVQALVGEERQVWIDPVPPWLNPMFTRADPLRVLRRLLTAEVGLEHVLALGVAFNAGPELASGGHALATNVWVARNGKEHASVLGLMDAHQPLKRDGDLRSYLVQLHGDRLRIAGITMAGWPIVFSGFNHDLFYGLSTPPKVPGPVRATGAPFRLSDEVPHAAEAWSAALEPGGPPRFRMEGEDADEVVLERHEVRLRVFDAEANAVVDDPAGPRVFWRVPARVEPLASRRLGFPVTDPVPGTELDPAHVRRVTFEGRSFLAARNALETFLRLARCARTGAGEGAVGSVLDGAGLSFGRAELLLAGDAAGGLEYTFLANPARPGAAARETGAWRGEAPLDGRVPGHRWAGFEPFGDLPRLVQPPGYGEDALVWLNCNSSPHFVRPREAGAYAFEGPPWVYDDQPWATLRHARARELFERVDGPIARADVEAIALDVQDVWSVRMWPLFAALRAEEPSELARRFLDWVERRRFEETGDGRHEEFLAHARSSVMPFLTLLLARLEAGAAALPAPTADEVALAFDQVAVLPRGEALLEAPEWERVRGVLRSALEEVATLFAATRTGGEGGLATRRFLADLARCDPAVPMRIGDEALRPPDPGDALLPSWGEVNRYVVTPHVLSQPVRDAREGWLVSLLAPCTFETLAPFYRRMPAAAAPVGGTRTSLFHAHALERPGSGDPLVQTAAGPVYVVPVDFGTQVLFAVELTPGDAPRARALPALGATEILIDLPGNGTRADDHFAPLADFLAGRWSDLVLDEAELERTSVRTLELLAR